MSDPNKKFRFLSELGFEKFGHATISFFRQFGEITILAVSVGKNLRYLFRDHKLILEQMINIGVNSLVLVFIVAVFAGMVSSIQAGYQLQSVSSANLSLFLGSATAQAICIELGPVLTGLVLAGRIGASIAAELGTMSVTEQIEALEVLAIDPNRYLAFPRVVAAVVMLPILVIYSDVIALVGAAFVGYVMLDVNLASFVNSIQLYLSAYDVMAGLSKALIFGWSISMIGCYVGFSTRGGAEGVGLATIKAFVLAAASILVNDYILATILF